MIPERKTPWTERRKPRIAALPPFIATLKFDNETRVITNIQRQPVEAGQYGRVEVIDNSGWIGSHLAGVDLINPHLGLTALELREAAHLFNQIAEQLDSEAPPEPPENKPHTFQPGDRDGVCCAVCRRGYLAAIHWEQQP